MKLKKLIPILSFSFLGVILISAVNQPMINAKAAFGNETIIKDDFDANELGDEWINNGALLKPEYSSFRLHPNSYDWSSHVVCSKFYVSQDTEIDMVLAEHNTDGWFGISFGAGSTNTTFSVSRAACILFEDSTSFMDDTTSGVLTGNGASIPSSPFKKIDEKGKVHIELHMIDKYTWSIHYEVRSMKDEVLGYYDYECSSLEGYVGFNSNYKSAEIFEFKIKDADKEYYDDFKDSTVLYPDSGDPDGAWVSMFYKDDFAVGNVGELDLSALNSSIIYCNPFKSNNSDTLYRAYEITAKFHLSTLSVGADTGFEIGKPSSDESGYFFGLRRRNIGYSLVAYGNNLNETINCSYENADMIISATLTVNYDGSIVFITDQISLEANIDKVDGYFGLATYQGTALLENASGALVDDYVFIKDTHTPGTSPDMSVNFDGVKIKSMDGFDYYEYYYRQDEWYTGSNISTSMYRSQSKNGSITFTNATIDSAFGPRCKYKDFICRFDAKITSSHNNIGAQLGLQFGKSTLNASPENTPVLGLYQGEDRTVITTTQGSIMPGYSEIIGDNENLFVAGEEYNFVYVVKDNICTMFFKNIKEDDSVLLIPRAEKYFENTEGYASIYGNGGIGFVLDNVSFTNIDLDITSGGYQGEGQYQETTRLDFSLDNSSNGVTLDNAQIQNKALKIKEDGNLSTVAKINNNLLRIKTKNIEDTLEIKLGGLVVTLINGGSKQIQIKDKSYTYSETLTDDFVFENATFEFFKRGNKFEIKYVTGDKPISLIDNSKLSYTVVADSNYDNLTITSINGEASLTYFVIYNLDEHITIKAYDFNPDTDAIDPWPTRTSIQDIEGKNKGCKGSIIELSIVLLSVACFGLIASIFLKRKER